MSRFKDWTRTRPAVYDALKRIQQRWFAKANATHDFFDALSKSLDGRVSFIQIGANDGLRNDPIREFIVRDAWTGALVEPLPDVFELLKRNYAGRAAERLQFVNAAVSSSRQALNFWSFREDFLAALPLEQRLDYLRKASFDKEHVRKFLPPGHDEEKVLKAIPVHCLTVNDLILQRFPDGRFGLLAIDAEGHDAEIIGNMDFTRVSPRAIFFESQHLRQQKAEIFALLEAQGYALRDIGGDSAAVKRTHQA